MTVENPLTPVEPAGLDAPDAAVVAAWAVVRTLTLRQPAVTLAVEVRGEAYQVRVDLDATPTSGDLVAHCAAALAEPASGQDRAPGDVITLVLTADGRAALRHRPGAVDEAQAALLARLPGRALREMVAVGHRPVADLDLLDDDDRGQPARWRQAADRSADGPAPERHRVIGQWARRDPTRLALVYGEHRLTYGDLDARANRLAHLLVDRGVGPDVRVAVCLHPGVDLVVGLLAVVKAGGCYLPVDPGHPPARVAFVLDDAGAAVILCDEALPAEAAGDRPVLRLDTDTTADLLAAYPDTPPADPVGDDRLGYLLYTSGSTGEPKGVEVPENAVANLLRAVGRHIQLRPGEATLFSSAPVFDISTVEIFLPLMSGAHVVVAGRGRGREPSEIVRLVDTHDVRFMQATPSAWRPLADALATGGRRDRLRVLTAGEPLTPDLARRLCAVAGRVINGYGPTETTVYSTLATITDPADVTIGEPIDDTTLYVVDTRDRLVPAGVPGELLIGGRGVARGYINRPDLTARRFVPDVWGRSRPPGTVYRTGDLVWWAPDGRLRAVGRIDDQVKVRGHRIEPAEVQARLDAHPDIAACVVRAREFGPDDTRLVAFVVTADGAALPLTRLRQWCAGTLPDHMIPTVCVTLPRLPLTASGKVDDRALPDAARVRAQVTADTGEPAERVAPRTAAERAVARIWREALWADDLGVHDDFFDLGGDSLVATQVTLQLQREFVVDVPIRAIFQYPTVAGLAARLAEAVVAGGFPDPDQPPARGAVR